MKPNIFQIATRELSQDAFFTWLLQWANEECALHDEILHAVAQNFVRLLVDESSEYCIKKVIAGRQFAGIDIWAEVNEQYFIAIEDKTYTGQHSNQLERYKAIAEEHCKEKQWAEPKLIYLKTGNESLDAADKVSQENYKVISRKKILTILSESNVANDTFRQFVDYWAGIENITNSFHKFENLKYNLYANQGFFSELQSRIKEWSKQEKGWSHWGYVSTPTGGFWGLWYHWQYLPELGELYIQIDNDLKGSIELYIKMNVDGQTKTSVPVLRQILSELAPFAEKYGLTIRKPQKFRSGRASRLAIVNGAFRETEDGDFDFEHLVKTLKNLEKTIDEYCQSKERKST